MYTGHGEKRDAKELERIRKVHTKQKIDRKIKSVLHMIEQNFYSSEGIQNEMKEYFKKKVEKL